MRIKLAEVKVEDLYYVAYDADTEGPEEIRKTIIKSFEHACLEDYTDFKIFIKDISKLSEMKKSSGWQPECEPYITPNAEIVDCLNFPQVFEHMSKINRLADSRDALYEMLKKTKSEKNKAALKLAIGCIEDEMDNQEA